MTFQTVMKKEVSRALPLLLCIVHLEPLSSRLWHDNFHSNHFSYNIMQMNVALHRPHTTLTVLSSSRNGNATRKCEVKDGEGEAAGVREVRDVVQQGRTMTDGGWLQVV